VKSLADEEGQMLMARVWGSMRLHFLGRARKLLETTTCEDYKQLGPAVYHSTSFLQSHNSHKTNLATNLVVEINFLEFL